MDVSQIEQAPTPFRLLASEIDRIARETPERPWASIPKNPADLYGGFEDVTYSQFAAAIDRASWFIHDALGPAEPGSFPTVAYCGPSDLRYYLLTIAAVKTGYKLLMLLGGKYTTSSLQHILTVTDCQYFLRDKDIVLPSIEIPALRLVNVPEEHDLLTFAHTEPYKYEPKFPSALNDPLFVLHTSGSVGKQKPVVYRQGSMAMYSGIFDIPKSSGGQATVLSQVAPPGRVFTAFPIAHGGGVCSGLICSVYLGFTITIVKNDPLSVQTLLAVLRQVECRQVLLTPYTCIELVKSPEKSEIYEKLSIINFAGGPLPNAVGDELCKHVYLINAYGQTEHNTPIMHLRDDDSEWEYINFSPEWCNFEFRPAVDELYEAFVIKQPDLYHRYFQPVFWIFPDIDEWHTDDLWSKHPTKAHHWKFEGRADDILTLSGGTNFNPARYEDIWKKNSMIKNAIIVGNGRKNLGAVIELQEPSLLKADQSRVESDLQESLDEFNQRSTMLCQLSLKRVVFCEEGETLPRTGKGTFSRKQIESVFRERLDRLDT